MAARKSPLRAVAEGESPPPKPLTVKAAAESGQRRALLVALRSRIAKDIDSSRTPARDLAALSRRLLEIAKEIEAIESEERNDDVSAAADTPDEEWSAQ